MLIVDFACVCPAHEAIDARLTNWARWSHNRTGTATSPMFRLYRSTEQWQPESAAQPIDAIDAQRIQRAVRELPTNHRLAISWAYIKRTHPAKAARSLGKTLQELAELISSARQILIARNA